MARDVVDVMGGRPVLVADVYNEQRLKEFLGRYKFIDKNRISLACEGKRLRIKFDKNQTGITSILVTKQGDKYAVEIYMEG